MSTPARRIATAALGLAGAHLGLRLGSRTSGPVGPLRVTASVEWGRTGGVDLDIPPLGTAHLATHRGPLRVRALATGIATQHLPAGRADLDAALQDANKDVRELARQLAYRSAAAALAGAAALAAIARHNPAGAALTAAAALAVAAARATATEDRAAWRDPKLDGLLTEAPRLLGDLRDAPAKIAKYRDQLAELVHTGTSVLNRIDELPDAPPADVIRLLHVSDIHLSPVAFPLLRAAVEQYRVDAVVDTGDLVDWGTSAEAAFADQIAALPVPYVYVKGNHDSAAIAEAVARQPNAVVLDTSTPPQTVAGLAFAGQADPRFTPDKTTGDDRGAHKIAPAAEAFAATLDGQHVDVALVHSPTAARALAGRVGLVLAGDVHRRSARRENGTTVLVQASTGGAGLRGVQEEPPTPFALSVLFLDRTTHELWGVDEITLGGLGRTEISVVRRRAADLVR